MRVTTSLSCDSMWVGDQVEMTLRIAYKPAIAFTFPLVGDTLMPHIEVLRQSKLDTLKAKKQDTMVTVERRYTLTCFDAGVVYTLPQFQFVVQNFAGSDTISSNLLTLKVMFPPMDSTWTPNDIKPPIEYPITFAEAAPYVGGALLLMALLALGVYWLNKRRKNQPLFFAPKPKEPAHIIALRDLQKLKIEQLWQQGKIKEFYTRISEIVRVYIEDRFAIAAMEQTSDEILADFETQNTCPKEILTILREVFVTSDLVKFAKHTTAPDENETCFQSTLQFIEKTKFIEKNENKTMA
ncbi:hypothetical protein FACS1894156_5280 [Bacteroidia bacterium]|nr:hypothetical protein FACS1894156_5280 [Bacteroidia bacterium]